VYLVYSYGISEYYRQLRDVAGVWILIALCCMTLSNILGSAQWNLILRDLDIRLPFRRTLAFYYTGLFFNNFLLSFVGGDLMRVYDISRSSGRNSDAISTVFLDRLVGLFTMTLFACAALFYTLNLLKSNFLVIIIVTLLGVISFLLFFLYSKPFAKKFELFGRYLLPERFHGRIREIYNALHYCSTHPVLLGKLFLLSLFVQSLRILVHYCTSRSLGVDAGLAYFFLFIPIIVVLITLPVSIGGIGVRESSGAMLFAYVGVAATATVLFEGMAYIVAILCSLPGILTFIFRKHELLEKENP